MQKQMNIDTSEDQSLWTRVIQGDRNALGIIFDIYAPELLTYGFRISGNKALTKDAIQDIFVDIWVYRRKLAETVQVKFYLYRCLRRALFKSIPPPTLESIHLSQFDHISWIDLSPEMQWIEAESQFIQRQEITDSLKLLSDREREIISLKYYSDLKIREISILLGIKEQTVSNTLQNALVKLRKNLTYLYLLLFLI
jgi:RNA polymerase sigma factor (sigma-70 family)